MPPKSDPAQKRKEYFYNNKNEIRIILLGDKNAGKTTYFKKLDDAIKHKSFNFIDLNNRKSKSSNPSYNTGVPLHFGYYFKGRLLKIKIYDTADDTIGSDETYTGDDFSFGIIFLDISKPFEEISPTENFKILKSWIHRISKPDPNGDIELYPWKNDGTLDKSTSEGKRKLNFPFAIVGSKSDIAEKNFSTKYNSENAIDDFNGLLIDLISGFNANIFYDSINTKEFKIEGDNLKESNFNPTMRFNDILLAYFSNKMQLSFDSLIELEDMIDKNLSSSEFSCALELNDSYVFEKTKNTEWPISIIGQIPKHIHLKKHLTTGGQGSIFIAKVTEPNGTVNDDVIIKITLQESELSLARSLAGVDKTLYIQDYLKKNPEDTKYFVHLYSKHYQLLPIIKEESDQLEEYLSFVQCEITIMEKLPRDLKSLIEDVAVGKETNVTIDFEFKTRLTKELIRIGHILEDMKIVHRDIAPQNTLIDTTRDPPLVKIIDFDTSIYEEEISGNLKALYKYRMKDEMDSIVKAIEKGSSTNATVDPEKRGRSIFWIQVATNFSFGRYEYASPELFIFYFITGAFKQVSDYVGHKDIREKGTKLVNTLPKQYRDIVLQKKYGTGDNWFSIGIILFSIWFGENHIFDTSNDDLREIISQAIEKRIPYVARLLPFTSDTIYKEFNALKTVTLIELHKKNGSEFIKDIYTAMQNYEKVELKHMYTEPEIANNPTFIKEFLDAVNIPRGLKDQITSNPILLTLTYFISFLLFPNPYSDISLKLKSGMTTPATRIHGNSIKNVLSIIENLTKFDDFKHKHVFNVIYTPILANKIRLFDVNEFGKRASDLFLYKESTHIEVKRVEQGSIIKKTCGHKLELNKLMNHLLRNQEKIRTNYLSVCYKCS